MQVCPRCGMQNPPDYWGCAHCGQVFAQANQTQTMAGHLAPGAPPQPAAAPPQPAVAAPQHAPPQAPPQHGFRGTIIGMAAPNAPVPAPAALPSPPAQGAPEHSPRFAQTMLGVAAPNLAAPPSAPAAVPSAAAPPAPAAATVPHFGPTHGPAAATIVGNPPIHSATKTVLGIARPGIAPLNPGQAKPPADATAQIQPQPAPLAAPAPARPGAQQAGQPQAARHRHAIERAPLAAAPRADTPKKAKQQRIPLLAALALVGAASLFTAAGVAWFLARGHGAVEARVELGPDGSERLGLSCARCDDGSSAQLDGKLATFAGHHASLELVRPIKVGENAMSITLTSKGGNASSVSLSVPLEYRVHGDLSGLDAEKPELRVLVNALPGSLIQIDGQAVALNADGQATYSVDVSHDLTGLEASVQRLVRKLSYTVTPPGGSMQSGEISLQIGVVPLAIDAPGPSIVLESPTFVLAGSTIKGGALKVGDRPITVDPAGRFAQMMNVSSLGETTITVRANAKDYAPRLMPLRVRRVESLAKEAARLEKQLASTYSALTNQMDVSHGLDVALEGTVSDVRSESYSTVVLLDMKSGCAASPCLVKVTCGTPLSLAKRDKVQAVGQLVGSVDGPRTGSKIPQVRADFLVKAGR